jgi:hypothetical protein
MKDTELNKKYREAMQAKKTREKKEREAVDFEVKEKKRLLKRARKLFQIKEELGEFDILEPLPAPPDLPVNTFKCPECNALLDCFNFEVGGQVWKEYDCPHVWRDYYACRNCEYEFLKD